MSTPGIAASAYRNLARLVGPASGEGNAAALASQLGKAGGDSQNFGSMVADVVEAVSGAGKTADSSVAQAAQGRGDLVDIVTAVAESEVALETLVSVRDRMIAAYEEVMRMPI